MNGSAFRWTLSSNLAYPVAGVAVALWRPTPVGYVLAALYLALFVGSFGYHWWEGRRDGLQDLFRQVQQHLGTVGEPHISNAGKSPAEQTRRWARVDVAAMFALLIGIALAATIDLWWLVLVVAVLPGIGLRFHVVKDMYEKSTAWTIALAASAIVAVAVVDLNRAAIGAGLLMIAAGIRQEGERLEWGWSHGVWHVLAALGTAVLAGGGA